MNNVIIFVPYLNFVETWIDPIYPFLKRNGYNIIILHIQSLSFGVAHNSEIDKKYITYDIGKMSISNVERLLVKLNPEVIIFFHFKSFADFLVLRISKHLGIKSIYIQHGLYYSKVFKFVIAKKGSSFLRYIFHLKQYIQLIIKNKKNVMNELYLAYRYLKKTS